MYFTPFEVSVTRSQETEDFRGLFDHEAQALISEDSDLAERPER